MEPVSDRIYLVRHGQTEWNRLGLTQGHTDICLDADGESQGVALGSRFRDVHLDWVVSSDLQRSAQTARFVRPEVDLDSDLRERGFGEWEGRPYDQVRSYLKFGTADVVKQHAPSAESFDELWTRIGKAHQRLLGRHGTGLVVTHGGSAGVLLAHFLHANPETAFAFRFSNTAVCILERNEHGPYRLLLYNCTTHLAVPALMGDLTGAHTK